tara:strand:- start:1038 stop:1655 length:618 start_codon:yes stop_codon:yes gene_type:complete
MSHERNLKYFISRSIVYRRDPINDRPTSVYDWGEFYEDGTFECYSLFRSRAKITTYKSLKWHLLVIWYLNPNLLKNNFKNLAEYICEKSNGFVTFDIDNRVLSNIVDEVEVCDLERPPKNKLRKIIFNDYSLLTPTEKMSIVGTMIGKSKKIHKDDIYQCMIDLNDSGGKITINKIASMLDCSSRTIHRTMCSNLKKEKEILNNQ